MVTKTEILNFVQVKGPVIPNQIKKQFGGELYLISAYLSELVNQGQIKVSHTKIGGSPTYYAPGSENKLQELKKYLNSKDQRTFDKLKEELIIRDKNQEMLIRVSLRNIKDFAKQLEVKLGDGKEIFWKWYMLSNSEAEQILRNKFFKKPVANKQEEQPKTEDKPIENTIPVKQEQQTKPEPKHETQSSLNQKLSDEESEFIEQMREFFNKNNIQILEEEVIRKSSELDYIVKVPSNIGEMEYYCKAKNKKKCNDGDLSSAYVQGQLKKLPVIFITTGDVTNKAKEMLGKEFKGMVLKQI